jgi:Spy/CpxP family protein refolding chaperone
MKPRTIIHVALAAALLALNLPALAQGPGGKGGPPRGDAFKHELFSHLYPVELVRAFADEIKLTDDQIAKLRKVVADGHAEVENLQWDVAREARKLADLVEKGAARDKVFAQLDAVFVIENKLKKAHLGLLLQVRDILTAKQRAALDDVKKKHGPGPGPGPGGPGGPGGPSEPRPF